jgi:AraC-like DNA-binding protein
MAGKGRGGNGKGPEEVTTREREALVVNLRRSGMTYDQIAREVGYGSSAAAYKAFKRVMDRTIREPADEYRALHRERL